MSNEATDGLLCLAREQAVELTKLRAEIERLSRLAKSESEAKEMAWAKITNAEINSIYLTELVRHKNDEISVLTKERDEIRDELREANRMLDKYHSV
jgi:chromosome segregation ATPase